MNRYTITGSLGNISKPIVEGLVRAGKEVSVITSNAGKVGEIEKLGAKAIVGSLDNSAFVAQALKGADVVYTMIPPVWATENWKASQLVIAKNYADAITINKIRYVVNLSSVGAHLGHSCGPVDAIHDFEQMLNKIPDLNVRHLRAAFFYNNFLNLTGLVRQAGILGANYGKEGQLIPLVHPQDIAAAALEELLTPAFTKNSVRYIVSDFRTGKEIASVLGKAIGKDLPWVLFTDEQQREGLAQGVPPTHVDGYLAMGIALREGLMQEEVIREKATGKTKLEEFAGEFAAAYNQA